MRVGVGRGPHLPVSMASMACTSWIRAASCSFLAQASWSWVPVLWSVAHTAGEVASAQGAPAPSVPGRTKADMHTDRWRCRHEGPRLGEALEHPRLGAPSDPTAKRNHPHFMDETTEGSEKPSHCPGF